MILTGEIPPTLCKTTSLWILDLSSNELNGSIPSCLGNLSSNLQIVKLSKNQFKGTLPTFCTTNIVILDLSSNMLSGSLPHCLFTNTSINLNILDLHDNQLQGTIPQITANSCKLTTFNINNNHFQGSIPSALANCKQLQILDFGNNKMKDSFPSWMVALPELQILILRSNRFQGNLKFKKMEHPFSKLRIMDLSHNQFNGNLPINFFDNFKLMGNSDQNIGLNTTDRSQRSYYEASVSLIVKGMEFEVKRILNIYTSIDLSSNKFDGGVPQVIGELKSLRLLNLSHNSLTGHIPSLKNMSTLESLDLSSNQLAGNISWQLTGLTFLSTLNLSENHLSGPIPHGGQFDTFSNDSFLGNLDLCGGPLTKQCKDDELPAEEVDTVGVGWFDWQMILIGYGSGLVCGLSTGYLVFTTFKPLRFVIFIERVQQKLVDRYN